MKAKIIVLSGLAYLALNQVAGVVHAQPDDVIQVSESEIGFVIPNFSQFLSFMIRFFFVLAGLMALFYMLWGALSWVTSGGSEDGVAAARKKIVAAVVGVMLIVATLAIIVALEQVVFKEGVCFGISCPLRLPSITEKTASLDVDMDNDGLPNGADPDTDGDGLCNTGGTVPDANPGRRDPSCSGEDFNDDDDLRPDATDTFPTDPTQQ